MSQIYQITIHGRKMEGRDLRQLLARAVREKRNLDARLRISARRECHDSISWSCVDSIPVTCVMGALQ
jgi:hypothetical protein